MKIFALSIGLALALQSSALGRRATTSMAYNAGFKTSTVSRNITDTALFTDDTTPNQASGWPLIYGLETDQDIADTGATEAQKQANSLTWKFTCEAAKTDQAIRLLTPDDAQSGSFYVRYSAGPMGEFYIPASDSNWAKVTTGNPQIEFNMDVQQGQQNYVTLYPSENGAVVLAIKVPSGCAVVDYSDGQFDQLTVESLTGPTVNISYISGGQGNAGMKRYEFHSNSIAAAACEHYGLVLATTAQVVGHKNCGYGYVSDDVDNIFMWMPEDNTDPNNCEGRAGSSPSPANDNGGAYCVAAPPAEAMENTVGGAALDFGLFTAIGADGDTVYKCHSDLCFKNVKDNRGHWDYVGGTDTFGDFSSGATVFATTATTSDGTWTVSDDGISFQDDGTDVEFFFSTSCSCAQGSDPYDV